MGVSRQKGTGGDFCPRQALAAMNRRDFAKWVSGLGALALLEPQMAAMALVEDKKRLSWLAHRTAGAEGSWALNEIEGEVPEDLAGTLYRIAPGQSENHGIQLKHLFDGDAFISGYTFDAGKVHLRAQFVATPERLEEEKLGKMIYSEFGTLAPPTPEREALGKGRHTKNQPSVNVIHYDGRLLGLSEGGHPTEIDPATLAYRSRWDFHGTLPRAVPFTAHPKYDPATGEAYGYGVGQGPGTPLMVFRMEKDGRLTKLFQVPLKGYFMVHDMLMSKSHLIFVMPPVRFDLPTLLSGEASVADAMRWFEAEPLRMMVLRRDGTGEPAIFEQPSNMVYHNGNAFERDGKIVLDTLLTADNSVNEMLHSWSQERLLPSVRPKLTRIALNLETKQVESRTELENDQEFPRFDIRQSGADARHLITLEGGLDEDPIAFTRLVRHDLAGGKAARAEAEKGRCFGEAVFVPRAGEASETNGWLLAQIYDAHRDQTALEIRDAATLELAARVWTGQHFPLGFHGNFAPGARVSDAA